MISQGLMGRVRYFGRYFDLRIVAFTESRGAVALGFLDVPVIGLRGGST